MLPPATPAPEKGVDAHAQGDQIDAIRDGLHEQGHELRLGDWERVIHGGDCWSVKHNISKCRDLCIVLSEVPTTRKATTEGHDYAATPSEESVEGKTCYMKLEGIRCCVGLRPESKNVDLWVR